MNFFIKKRATLPILRVEVNKDGRSNFHNNQNLSDISNVYVSFIDFYTKQPKYISRPCTITSEVTSGETSYYVNYQFSHFETEEETKYETQFSIINSNGNVIILPLKEKVFVNIVESFAIDGFDFSNNYEVDYPCCKGSIPDPSTTPTSTPTLTPTNTPTPNPTSSPTSTPTPTPTVTRTSTPTPTTTPTITPTITPTSSITPTVTPSISLSPSVSPSSTPTVTPTKTPTVTPTTTQTVTPTSTVTPTVSPTISSSPAVSPSVTPTNTVTPTKTSTPTITPTSSITPSITPTSTVTPTVSPSYIPPSNLVYSIDNQGTTYSYNFVTNEVLNPTQIGYPNTVVWIGKYVNSWWAFDGYTTLYRKNGINLPASGFYSTSSVSLTDPSICVLDSNNVLFVRNSMSGSQSPRDLVLGTVANNSFNYTFKGTIPYDRYAVGGIIKTNTNKIIIITTNSFGTQVYLNQYPYNTSSTNTTSPMVSEVQVNLTNIISNPRGIYVANNQFYIVNASGGIYQIQKTSPYTITYVTSIGRTVKGIAQDSINWTIEFT